MGFFKELRKSDRFISALILFFIMIITFIQIILRSFFNIPLIGVEELSRYLFIAFIFVGLPYYFRQDGHIKLEGIQKHFPEKIKHIIDIVIQSSGVLIFSIISFSAAYTTLTNYSSSTPTLSIPFWLFFLPTIAGFTLLTIEHIKHLVKTIKKQK